jgi:hypothetical protein
MVAAFVAVASTRAAEPPPAPILRIETAMHPAMVRRLVVDPRGGRLISAGDDKTIRVWQLPQGRLARVLRFPIGAGYEGRIYALAVSPDGERIAAGGWTGWEWDKQGAVYLFDLDSGELVRYVGGFPDVIGALAYSKDGGHLAVGLHGDAGLTILRTTDYTAVARDAEYRDKVLGADFRADGVLAVAALDGQLRLYDRDFRLLGRKRTAPGTQPLTVRFSPDGRRLAVSFHDVPALAVFDAADLSLAFAPDTTPLVDHVRIADVAWSADGEALYGCGDYAGAGENPVLRWRRGGRGAVERLPGARGPITDLQPLPGGGVAFAAEDPAIGTLDAAGRRVLFRGPELAGFPPRDPALKVSRDASRVQFAASYAGAKVARFALFARELLPGPASGTELAGAVLESPRFALERWQDLPSPALNGVQLVLDDYELARAYAIGPDHATLVLGTEWALRAYGADASLRWRVDTPGAVRGVIIAPNGQSVVAALSDGTIRWHRMEDGAEFLALFSHATTREWIAWNREGYYVSSSAGDEYVGWHLNRGRERSADFYRAVQFERILYRPDLLDESFRRRGRPAEGAGRRAGARFDVSQLGSIAPPRVRLELTDTPRRAPDGGFQARLRIEAERTAGPMVEQALFVNNVPVTSARLRRVADGDRARFTREVTVNLAPGENRIRAEVSSATSLGFAETHLDVDRVPAVEAPAGDLYLLAVGVNEFPRLKDAGLAYAARDAEEVARFFRAQAGGAFRRVHVRSISDLADEKPDRAAIVAALDFAAEAGERDTVILFLASHGLSDPAGEYFLVPRDARAEDIAAVALGRGAEAASLIRWNLLVEALRGVAGRRVLIVDTCYARNVEGRADLQTLAKRSAASRISLVLAAQGHETSQEYAPARQGLFTHALLEGLRGSADADGDRRVTLAEAFDFVVPAVERLRDRSIGAQTPQLVAPEPLGETALARVAAGATGSASGSR